MPIPFAAAMLGGLGGFLAAKGANAASSLVDPLLLPAHYGINYLSKTLMPEEGMLTNAYLFGGLDGALYYRGLGHQNIFAGDVGQTPQQKITSQVIANYLYAQAPKLTIDQVYYAYYSGIIDNNTFKDLMKYYKVPDNNILAMMDISYAKFDMDTLINNYYRGYSTKTSTIDRIRRVHGCYEDDATKILNSTQFIPPPTDMLRFLVRDVFDVKAQDRLGLRDEYDSIASSLPWLKALGISENTTLGDGNQAQPLNVPLAYWIAHWTLMSPQQAYESYHRFRSNRLDRYKAMVPDIKEFTFSDLTGLLKSNDYVPTQRSWLAGISFRQLGRIDLRRLFNDGIISSEELREQYRDNGYVDADVDLLMQWSVKQRDEKKRKDKEQESKDNWGKAIEETFKSYEVGAIDRTSAYESVVNMGMDEQIAEGRLVAIDLHIQRERVAAYVKMVKGEFFLGLYDGLSAYVELVAGGLTDIRANNYVILWQRQLSRPRRLVSIQTVIKWLTDGFISFADAKTRLSNLGLSNEDTTLYLAAANMDIQKQVLIEETKLAKSQQAQAEKAKQLEKELRQAKRTAITELKAYSSISQMGKWVQQGQMTLTEAVDRMTFMEIPQEDQDRYIVGWFSG